ncbi:hypothetical protein [Pseudobdellovibrio exovorus]|uniref:Uncharacterized protein n=1 Tax=Pseudobdellovibrio exovorus JSS TaxID=1184267 RepID=M4V8K3_9BACT|nr:hypothetical protein [Pseudobdellovibrio exovorus]AGH94341.1 hypothetical protein A11Q_121 [Pseudobdellovibrio exovorus JSS]
MRSLFTNRDSWPIYFLSAAIFALLVFISPVVSSLLLGAQLQSVFLAPLLGFALCTSLFLLFQKTSLRIPFGSSAVLVFFSVLFLFLALVQTQLHFDQTFIANLSASNENPYLKFLFEQQIFERIRTAVVFFLLLPFFFYSFFLMSVLSKTTDVVKVYRQEVVGALSGTLLSVLILESLGFRSTLLFIFTLIFIALLGLFRRKVFLVTVSICYALTLGILFLKPAWVTPQRNIHLIVRDYQMKSKVDLIHEDWTTFAKVQTFDVEDPVRKNYSIISIGDGTGLAGIPNIPLPFPITTLGKATVALKPQADTAAVLFAGAGRDLRDLDVAYKGKAQLLGIEINSKIIKQAQLDRYGNSKQFLEQDHIDLRRMEARHFLENQLDGYPDAFDILLFSWSGATVAHYAGSIAHTTQFAFTSEAIEQALKKVKPEGFLIIAGGSKVNILLTMKELEAKGHLSPLAPSVLLLGPYQNYVGDWKRSWDDLILVWKNGPITEDEVSRLKAANLMSHEVILSPFESQVDDLRDLVSSANYEENMLSLRQAGGNYFDIFTDDRPFVYNGAAPLSLLETQFWKNALYSFGQKQFFSNTSTVLILGLLFTALTFLFFVFKSRKQSSFISRLNIGVVAILCGLLGAGLQSLILFRLLLFIDNPTLSLLVGVCGGFLGAWIGTYIIRHLSFFKVILSTAFFCIVFLLGFQYFSFPFLLLSFALACMSYGAFFPLYLAQSQKISKDLLLFVWSLDAWGTVLGALLLPLYLENMGFQETQKFLFVLLVILLSLSLLNKRIFARTNV